MNSNPAKNDWELRFGNKRRLIDRDLLAEAERQIAREERLIPDTPNPTPPRAPSTAKSSIASPARSVRPLRASKAPTAGSSTTSCTGWDDCRDLGFPRVTVWVPSSQRCSCIQRGSLLAL